MSNKAEGLEVLKFSTFMIFHRNLISASTFCLGFNPKNMKRKYFFLFQGFSLLLTKLIQIRHQNNESLAKFHITDNQTYLRRADESKAIGRDDDAILAYLFGGDYESVIYCLLFYHLFYCRLPSLELKDSQGSFMNHSNSPLI
jgi:hypothetical protein